MRQAWSTQCAPSDTGTEDCSVVGGFTCNTTSPGYEQTETVCEGEGGAIVEFKTGA